jgi:hypothetical protein
MNMNKKEILAMPAGRELDALVAEKVMGWTKGLKPWLMPPGFVECDVVPIPNYSTDIAAAWEVANKKRVSLSPVLGDQLKVVGWRAEVHDFVYSCGHFDAPDAPLAICRAALAFVLKEQTIVAMEPE